MNEIKKRKRVVKEMITSFKKEGISVIKDRTEAVRDYVTEPIIFHAWCKSPGGLARIDARYMPTIDMVMIVISDWAEVAPEKWPMTYELFNKMNGGMRCGKWVLNVYDSTIEYHSAMLINKAGLDEDRFRALIRAALKYSSLGYPFVHGLVHEGMKPEDVMATLKTNQSESSHDLEPSPAIH
jgi:hypothetical protein